MRRGCIHCGWNGHPQLCGCIGALGKALRAGDLVEARMLYGGIVGRANANEQVRREAMGSAYGTNGTASTP